MDDGGARETRSFWRFYYQETQAIIFVIDSSNQERFDEAREDLHRLLTEYELWDAPLLVLANKADKAGAASTREVTEQLQLCQAFLGAVDRKKSLFRDWHTLRLFYFDEHGPSPSSSVGPIICE